MRVEITVGRSGPSGLVGGLKEVSDPNHVKIKLAGIGQLFSSAYYYMGQARVKVLAGIRRKI